MWNTTALIRACYWDIEAIQEEKEESGGVSIILETGMEVTQNYSFLNYRPPIPHKYLKQQYRTIFTGTGMNLTPKCVHPGYSKEKFGKETPPDALIMDNL